MQGLPESSGYPNRLYTALLIKVLSYLLAIRLRTYKEFSKLSVTQPRRKVTRDYDFQTLLTEHFHLPILLT